LSPKNGPLGRRPGPGKNGQNNAKTPLLVTFPPEKLKPKTKKFFFDFDYKTFCIRRGFEQLSSSSGWWVMAKRVPAPILAISGRKGLRQDLYLNLMKTVMNI